MGKLFDELKQLKAEYDRKLSQEGEAALKDAFKDFFEANPEVESVYWNQYTPYFNDGDVCYFRVHEFDVSLKTPDSLESMISEKEAQLESASDTEAAQIQLELDRLVDLQNFCEETYGYGESLYYLEKLDFPRAKEISKAVSALQRELPNDVLESVFGDHASITATRDGFSIEEKDHD